MKHLSEYRQQDEHAEQLYTHAVANQNTVPLAKLIKYNRNVVQYW